MLEARLRQLCGYAVHGRRAGMGRLVRRQCTQRGQLALERKPFLSAVGGLLQALIDLRRRQALERLGRGPQIMGELHTLGEPGRDGFQVGDDRWAALAARPQVRNVASRGRGVTQLAPRLPGGGGINAIDAPARLEVPRT
jgi:hypothetical protein